MSALPDSVYHSHGDAAGFRLGLVRTAIVEVYRLQMGVRRLWLLRAASAVVGTTLLLAGLELTARVLPVQEPEARTLASRSDPIARFRPNEQWNYSMGWDFFIVNEQRTNNAGWVSRIEYSKEGDTPLLAFIGDSFVQADQVRWPDTCHGRLSIKLDRHVRVYSFGYDGAPLSQYLGLRGIRP